MAFSRLIQKGCRESCSVVLRQTISLDKGSLSNSWRHGSISTCLERVMMEKDGKQLLFTDPKVSIPLQEWTSYINQQNASTTHKTDSQGKLFVLVTASVKEAVDAPLGGGDGNMVKYSPGVLDIEPITSFDRIVLWLLHLTTKIGKDKLSECITPVAWRSSEVFGIIGECSEENLNQLALAFLRNCLEVEDNLQATELCTVELEGHAQILIRRDSTTSLSPVQSSTDLSRLHKSMADDPTLIFSNQSEASAGASAMFTRQRSNSRGESPDFDEDHEGLSRNAEDYFSKFEDGAGESLFSGMNEAEGSEPQSKVLSLNSGGLFGDACNISTSQESSPSKGTFNEEGGGEALSPSVEHEGLLAPFRMSHTSSKPPNVLIYCKSFKDSQRHFDVLKAVFSLCLNNDKYTIYHLKHDQVFSTPWIENTACLIISCDRLYNQVEEKFLDYFKLGGYVLSFSSTFDALFVEKHKQENFSGVLNLKYGMSMASPVTTICGRTSYNDEAGCHLDGVELRTVGRDTDGRSVIMEALHESSGGMAVLSQSNLDKDPSDMAISPEIYSILKQANPQRFQVLRSIITSLGLDSTPGAPPQLTPCHVITVQQKSKDIFLNSLSKRLKEGLLHTSKLNLHFVDHSAKISEPISAETIPVFTDPPTKSLKFSVEDYMKNLDTRELGQMVIHGDVVTSTMPFVDALMLSCPKGTGLIVVANRQTGGKGRGGNQWLSPEGCAMFSLHIKLSFASPLGQKLSFIQHITTLAVVEAVTSLQGYQDFPLRIKWPNDIYYEKTIKLGGAIVTSSIMGDAVDINIGCGMNVSNNNPTTCINELICQYNKVHSTNLPPLSTEQLIARTVTQIEQFVNLFQSDREEEFVEKYYQRWIHGSQRVSIQGEEGEVTIVGLDDYGYLRVQKHDGSLTSVRDDGNSFDMTKNLIIPKTQ